MSTGSDTTVTRYIIQRILSSLFVLFILSIIVFSMVRIIPGDPLAAFVDPANPDPAKLEALRAELGLDQPWITQYFSWLLGVVQETSAARSPCRARCRPSSRRACRSVSPSR